MAWIFTTDGNYVNFNGGGNLWRLHKDSNCISWHWDETGDLFFDVYDQEYTVKAGNIADVIINGVPLSAASGFPAAITAAFTGIGTQLVLSKTVTLTDAQIKALRTTQIEIVAAPGDNKFLMPIAANFVLHMDSGAYGNITDASFQLGYDGMTKYLSSPTKVEALLGSSSTFDAIGQFSIPYLEIGSGGFAGINMVDNLGITSINSPIVIRDDWSGGGVYTGGNAANTLKVTVYYVVVDL